MHFHFNLILEIKIMFKNCDHYIIYIYICVSARNAHLQPSFVYSLTYSQVFELTTDSFISFLLSIKQANTILVDASCMSAGTCTLSSSSRLCRQFLLAAFAWMCLTYLTKLGVSLDVKIFGKTLL